MKIPAATFLAMMTGWGAMLGGFALWQLKTAGKTTDIAATAFWVGLVVLLAWAMIVLPVISRFEEKKIFSDIRLSWLGWTVLAVASYSALAAVFLFPFYGWEVFVAAWYPAPMGFIAGIAFALFRRNSDERKKPNQAPEPTAPSGRGSS